MWISSFAKTMYWRNCPFPFVYFWLFCCKLVDHIWVGLFLGSQSVSLIFVSVFMPIWYYYDYHSFLTQFEIREHDASTWPVCHNSLLTREFLHKLTPVASDFYFSWPKSNFVISPTLLGLLHSTVTPDTCKVF